MRYIFIISMLITSPCAAQNVDSKIRKIYVPANRVEDWPKGDWVPVKSKTFQLYANSLPSNREKTPDARLRNANYQAVFSNGQLTQGTFSASLNDFEPNTKRSIEFETSGIEWTAIRAPNGQAVIGSTRDGRLIAEMTSGKVIQGQWTSSGRQILDETEFRLKLLPAMSSEVFITLPAGKSLEVSGTSLTSNTSASKKDQRIWKIQVGSRRECTIRVIPETQSRYPPISAKEQINWFVEKPTARLVAEYDFRILDRRDSLKLQYSIPTSLQIEQIIFNGEQLQTYRLDRRKNSRELSIQLPIQSRGAKYQLLITARCPFVVGRQWKVPMLKLMNHQSQSRLLHCHFDEPIQPVFFSNSGFRLVKIDDQPSGFPKLEFESTNQNSELSMYLNESDASIECTTISSFSLERFIHRVTSISEFSCLEGRLAVLEFMIPKGWNIRRIQCFDVNALEAVPFRWAIEQGNTHQQLNVQLRDPISSGNSILLELQAFQSATGDQQRIVLQPHFPSNAAVRSQWIQLRDQTHEVASSQFWKKVSPQSIEDRVPAWKGILGTNILNMDSNLFETVSQGTSEQLEVEVINQSVKGKSGAASNQFASGQGAEFTESKPTVADATHAVKNDSPAKADRTARCKIITRLSNHNDGLHYNHAKYEFVGQADHSEIIISEPNNTEITGVLVNDRAILLAPEILGHREYRFQLPETSIRRKQTIDVFFTTQQKATTHNELLIEIPELNFKIVSLEWNLASSAGSQVERVSTKNSTKQIVNRFAPEWKKSLFGPFAVSEIQTTTPISRKQNSESKEFTAIELTMPASTEALVVRLAPSRFQKRVSVVFFLVACLILIHVIQSASAFNARIILVATILAFVVGTFAKPVTALFCGALTFAGLISVLQWTLARRIRSLCEFINREIIWRGQLKPQQSAIVIIAMGLFGLHSVVAEDESSEPSIGSILIPYEDVANIDALPEVVFAERQKYESLKTWYTKHAGENDRTIIQSAEYSPEVMSNGVVRVKAKYAVSVDAMDLPYQLPLPLREVTFPGTSSCLVDGQEGEMIANETGDGVTVILSGSSDTASETTETENRNTPDERRSFLVEISFIPKMEDAEVPQKYTCGIPKIHFSKWIPYQDSIGNAIQLVSNSSSNRLRNQSVIIGPVDEIECELVRNSDLPQKPALSVSDPEIELATLFQSVDDGFRASTRITLQSQEKRDWNYIAFQLPEQCTIEDVIGDNVTRYYSKFVNRTSIVVIEFHEKPFDVAEISVNYKWSIKPNSKRNDYVLPLLKLLSPSETERKTITSNQFAVQHGRYEVSIPENTSQIHPAMTSAQFLENWTGTIESNDIQLSHKIQGPDPVVVQIEKVTPKLRAELSHEITIEDKILVLETLMTIEQAPAESSQLRVDWDRNFQIESVFSEYDGVQRKITPLVLKDKLLLLLHQPLKQRQTIFIKGKQSIGSGLPVQTYRTFIPSLPANSEESPRPELRLKNLTIRPIEVLESQDWDLISATPTFPEQGKSGQVIRNFKAKISTQRSSLTLRFATNDSTKKEQPEIDSDGNNKSADKIRMTEQKFNDPTQGSRPQQEYVIHQILGYDQKQLLGESFFVVSSSTDSSIEFRVPSEIEVLNTTVSNQIHHHAQQDRKGQSLFDVSGNGIHSIRMNWSQQVASETSDATFSLKLPQIIQGSDGTTSVFVINLKGTNCQFITIKPDELDKEQFVAMRKNWIREFSQQLNRDETDIDKLKSLWISRLDQLAAVDPNEVDSQSVLLDQISEIRSLINFDVEIFDSEIESVFAFNSPEAIQIQFTGESSIRNDSRHSSIVFAIILVSLVSLTIFLEMLKSAAERFLEVFLCGIGVLWFFLFPMPIFGVLVFGIGLMTILVRIFTKGESTASEISQSTTG